MGPRNLKRSHTEMEYSEPARDIPLIEKIRNMWEFASVMQFIFIFGKAVKIDEDFDIEVWPIPHLRSCKSLHTLVAEYV
jgi:hypothetical protein